MRSTISVRFGRSVSGSWVAMNASSSSREASCSSVRLRSRSKHLAHAQQAELDAELEHVERVAQHALRRLLLGGLLAHHVAEDVAPPEHAPGDLLQRGGAVRGQLAEDLRGLARGVVGHLERRRRRSSARPRSSSSCRSVRSSPGPARRRARPSPWCARRFPRGPRRRGPSTASPRRRICCARRSSRRPAGGRARARLPSRGRRAGARGRAPRLRGFADSTDISDCPSAAAAAL